MTEHESGAAPRRVGAVNGGAAPGRLVVGLEALPVATVLTDGLTNVTAANSRAARLLGRAVDRLVGRPLAAFATSGDGRAAFGLARDALAEGDVADGHLTFDVGRRRQVRVAANVVRLPTGGEATAGDRLVWALSDVQALAAELRESRRANERLARRLETAERRLSTETRLLAEMRAVTDDAIRAELVARTERDLLLQVVRDPVLRVDRDGIVVGGNTAAGDLLGVGTAALAGASFDALASSADAPDELRSLVPFASAVAGRTVVADVRLRDGEPLEATSATAALRAGPLVVVVVDRTVRSVTV